MNIHQAMLKSLPAWRSVKVGAMKSADEYRKALASGSAPKISWVEEIVGNPAFTCASQPADLELVAPAVEDLGFPDGGLDSKVREKAIALGLKPCPVEVLAALPDDMEQGIRKLFQDGPVQLGVLAQDFEIHLFAVLAGQVSDRPGKAVGDHLQRHHAELHGVLL